MVDGKVVSVERLSDSRHKFAIEVIVDQPSEVFDWLFDDSFKPNKKINMRRSK